MDERDEGEDAVGYRKPPKASQFTKGRSGNPAGRPRRRREESEPFHPAAEPTRRLLRQEGLRPVRIREGDDTVEVPMTQAVIRSVGVAAIKGRPMAQRTYLDHITREDERYRKENREIFDFWLDYRTRCRQESADAEKRGKSPPDFVPHPDDITFDYTTFDVSFDGAVNADHKAAQDKRFALRDHYFALSFYFGEFDRALRSPPVGTIGLLHAFSLKIDGSLPRRLRLLENGYEERAWHNFHRRFDARALGLADTANRAGILFKEIPLSKRRPRWVFPEQLGLGKRPRKF